MFQNVQFIQIILLTLLFSLSACDDDHPPSEADVKPVVSADSGGDGSTGSKDTKDSKDSKEDASDDEIIEQHKLFGGHYVSGFYRQKAGAIREPNTDVDPPQASRNDFELSESVDHVISSFDEAIPNHGFAVRKVDLKLGSLVGPAPDLSDLKPIQAKILEQGLQLLAEQKRLEVPLLVKNGIVYRAELLCISDSGGKCIETFPSAITESLWQGSQRRISVLPMISAKFVKKSLSSKESYQILFVPLTSPNPDDEKKNEENYKRLKAAGEHNLGSLVHPDNNRYLKKISSLALGKFKSLCSTLTGTPGEGFDCSMSKFVKQIGIANCDTTALTFIQILEQQKKTKTPLSINMVEPSGYMPTPNTTRIDWVVSNHAWNAIYSSNESITSLRSIDITPNADPRVDETRYGEKNFDSAKNNIDHVAHPSLIDRAIIGILDLLI